MFSELERSKSSQLIVRQETNLRVSDMPFNDQNNGDGYYTGDINDYGQPMGHGTLRYDDGTVFEVWCKDGYSEEMMRVRRPEQVRLDLD